MAQCDYIQARPVSVVTPVHSSLVGLLREYLTDIFPRGYFKEFYVSTEYSARAGYGALRGRFRPMQGSQLSQRRYPMLSIRVDPTAEVSQLGSLDSFWQGTKFLGRPSSLTPLLWDDTNFRRIGYEQERMICRFGVTIIVDTDLAGHDVLHFIKRTIPVERTVYLRRARIWTEIPGDILRSIWAGMGLGDGSNPGDMDTFSRYLRSNTAGSVQRAVSSATGRSVFSYYYEATPVMKIQGTPTISVSREGGVIKYAQVEMTVELDLPVPISYAYQQEVTALPPAGETLPFGSDGTTAYFGITVDLTPPLTLDTSLTLAFYIGIITGSAPGGIGPRQADTTDLSASVSPGLREYISLLLALGSPSEFIRVVLTRDGNRVDPTCYILDFETWELTILQSEVRYNDSYYVAVYCDMGEIERRGGSREVPSPYYSQVSGREPPVPPYVGPPIANRGA
jgi:hypothetical protein